jgi:hypothetical protein
MILKLIKKRDGSEFIQELEEKYGSIGNLQRLINKDPNNLLYPLDYDDWLYYLEHPREEIETEDVIFLKDTDLKMSDLELLDVIKKEHPQSIRNLSNILNKDIKTVHPKVSKLAKSGLLKLEKGPKNAKKPVVNFNKIEIEI